MPSSNYFIDKKTGHHKLKLYFGFPAIINHISQVFTTALGQLTLHIKNVDGVYVVSIQTDWDDVTKLSEFKCISAHTFSEIGLAFSKVSLLPVNKVKQYVLSIPHYQLDVVDGTYLIILCLSTMNFSIPSLTPTDLPPTLGETILESLYCDPTQGDVVFTFDRPTKSLPMDALPTYALSEAVTVLKRLGSINVSDDGAKRSDPPVASFQQVEGLGQVERFAQVQVLKAHKAILSQWPYFKAMFEGGFAESGPGERQIRIKDTKIKTFELLLRFMSTGRLSSDLMPEIVYSDALENEDDVSMEDLFLAADRYNVKELQDPLLQSLLTNLDITNVIPFLFRSAYMIPELREPVVKFVAKSCGSSIPKKNIRNTYRNHSDVFDILVDLLEANDELHP